MNQKEQYASFILKKWGWKPERIKASYKRDKGMPDFKCSDNRYVEIKGNISEGLSKSQIDTFYYLIRGGKHIYIMYVLFNNEIVLYRYIFRYIKVNTQEQIK